MALDLSSEFNLVIVHSHKFCVDHFFLQEANEPSKIGKYSFHTQASKLTQAQSMTTRLL